MKKILPDYGVEVIEVERKATVIGTGIAPEFISASKIRQAIKTDKLAELIGFLPDSTREFLYSDESLEVRNKIRSGEGRH
jgi:[citrate (pro-3S)-lyase] ligase